MGLCSPYPCWRLSSSASRCPPPSVSNAIRRNRFHETGEFLYLPRDGEGGSAAPSLTVGDGRLLKGYPAGRSGDNYYFKVIATQVAGTATGVYTSIPGRSPARQCIVSVVGSASGAITEEQAPANGVWLYSLMPSQEITASKENNDSIYNGGDGRYGKMRRITEAYLEP